MIIHCLPVSVYRYAPFGDCTNNGISNRFDDLLVYCPDGNIHFDSEIEQPLNFCVVGCTRWRGAVHYHLKPAFVDEDGNITERPGWWMYGGNIADTSDGRFRAISEYPLHIHDRQE